MEKNLGDETTADLDRCRHHLLETNIGLAERWLSTISKSKVYHVILQTSKVKKAQRVRLTFILSPSRISGIAWVIPEWPEFRNGPEHTYLTVYIT